jgi:hypothetical protein
MDFSPFAASFFAPHLFSGAARSQLGCGASALALVTGVAPEIISSQNGGSHFSDRFMVGFLRVRNFRTLRLTPRMITGARTKIGSNHVLLVSQWFRSDEGTWGVVYENFYYHNFEAYVLSSLAFLNRPIMSAYLIIHPKWRINCSVTKPDPKPRAKGRQLTLAFMRKHSEFTHLRTWT